MTTVTIRCPSWFNLSVFFSLLMAIYSLLFFSSSLAAVATRLRRLVFGFSLFLSLSPLPFCRSAYGSSPFSLFPAFSSVRCIVHFLSAPLFVSSFFLREVDLTYVGFHDFLNLSCTRVVSDGEVDIKDTRYIKRRAPCPWERVCAIEFPQAFGCTGLSIWR